METWNRREFSLLMNSTKVQWPPPKKMMIGRPRATSSETLVHQMEIFSLQTKIASYLTKKHNYHYFCTRLFLAFI